MNIPGGVKLATLESLLQNEYIRFTLILIGTIIAIIVSHFILKIWVKRIAGRKKSFSEFILKQLSIPIFTLIFLIGLLFATKSLSLLIQYDEWIDTIFYILFTLIIALLASRIITVFLGTWLKVRRGLERTPHIISKVISIIIFLIALLMILGHFNIDITPLVAIGGLGALAIGLALQSTLSNFFAGLHLISDKPIRVGDFIEVEGISGFVEDIGWRSTRINTLQNNYVIIPNGKLADSTIVNNSLPKLDMKIFVDCGVAYESDLKKVEKVTIDVAREIQNTAKGAARDFEPFIRYREFGDSNINFIAVLKVEQPTDQFPVKHEFIKALKERYDKEGIEISWPIRKIYNIK